MADRRDRLVIGERALLLGRVACGEIRRLDVRRFSARDRRWNLVGEFGTERGAIAAVIKANRAADTRKAAVASATGALAGASKGAGKGRVVLKTRRRRGGPATPQIRVGARARFAGPVYFGEILHKARSRYVAMDPVGAPLGVFRTARRALEALTPRGP